MRSKCSLNGNNKKSIHIKGLICWFEIVFLGKTYDVSPYDSQRSHPLMNLGVKWDLCVLFVQTAVKCQDCKFV